MTKQEMIQKLEDSRKKYKELQDAQEAIYQELIAALAIDDEPHCMAFDFIVNECYTSEVTADFLLELKKEA